MKNREQVEAAHGTLRERWRVDGSAENCVRNIVGHLDYLLTDEQKARINWHPEQSVSLAVMRVIDLIGEATPSPAEGAQDPPVPAPTPASSWQPPDSVRVRAKLSVSELTDVVEAVGIGCAACGVAASNLTRSVELLREIANPTPAPPSPEREALIADIEAWLRRHETWCEHRQPTCTCAHARLLRAALAALKG